MLKKHGKKKKKTYIEDITHINFLMWKKKGGGELTADQTPEKKQLVNLKTKQ